MPLAPLQVQVLERVLVSISQPLDVQEPVLQDGETRTKACVCTIQSNLIGNVAEPVEPSSDLT